jgi:hypothetical protein
MSQRTKHTTRRLRACLAAAAIVAGLGAFAATAEAVPANFWGVVPQATPTEEQFQRLARGGVDSVRIPIVWGTVQPAKGGPFDWSGIDFIVKQAAAANLEVLPFLTGAPPWAVPTIAVPGTGGAGKAPAHLPVSGTAAAAWSSFLRGAVERYGPNGSFWAENRTVPKRPIRTWQIWNEENFKYFVARPNPAEYGRLVKLSYPAIKAADPGAKVILGGLFAKPFEATKHFNPPRAYFAKTFLEQMYKRTPGVKGKFNGFALHPYTYFYRQLPADIEEVRGVLKANHDAGKGLWITELGWSSQPPTRSDLFAKGVGGQAAQLNGAFSLLERNQAKWKLRQVFWFSVDDQRGSCNFCDGTGLFGEGFKPKKSWFSFVRFAGGTP